MIGRAEIIGTKSNVAMKACAATQAQVSLWVMGRLGRSWKGEYQDAPLQIYTKN